MTKKDQRQREWMIRIADYKASGLTMAAWCTANHVTLEQLKYWTRKLKKVASRDASPETVRFIPVSVAESVLPRISTSLVVHVGHASITLQKGFDPQLLREAVEALSETC
ncbi:IS66 family insertion sequence element accessory protein TnpB [Paenibacillus alkaliterrae]|uniref:IS66 family insertion sequence element accessory protein TnpA n=1 Tax=Paenibacillus alkaliterrae TaxID=320909 RepID=UPI001F3D4B41|nr:IS66 family insertion sequence element accessory protein TnpB [Paenibacillus alkaliterrae]MCF2941938.1 IS66 family insertion sequence element accessory protein TnpB [Paenibacillus alkaliterrae]